MPKLFWGLLTAKQPADNNARVSEEFLPPFSYMQLNKSSHLPACFVIHNVVLASFIFVVSEALLGILHPMTENHLGPPKNIYNLKVFSSRVRPSESSNHSAPDYAPGRR